MLLLIGSVDNVETTPTPILDDSQQGYHVEDRLRLTLRSAVDDKTYTIEFRTEGDGTPTKDQMDQWMESGDLVRATCANVSARPFVHQDGKSYRSRGSVKEINGQPTTLDALIVFTGQAVTLASAAWDVETEVRAARGAYKKSQKAYRDQSNARRRATLEAQIPERAAKMRESQAQRQANGAAPDAAPATDASSSHKRA